MTLLSIITPAIAGTCLLGIVIVLSVLIVCGLPLGELTMGGQHKVFPKRLRFLLLGQLVLQVFFAVILLQTGGLIPLWFSARATRVVCIVLAAYLTLNTLMNAVSKSKKERCLMTPLSLATALCFWLTACPWTH